MQKSNLSQTVLIGLGSVSFFATGQGIFRLATGGDDLTIATATVGFIAMSVSAVIQILMILFFMRAAQPQQVSPTRMLFVAGYLVCVAASVTFGISSYSKYLGVHEQQYSAAASTDLGHVQSEHVLVTTRLRSQKEKLSTMAKTVDQIAVDEGKGTNACGPICGTYTGHYEKIVNTITQINATIVDLENSFNAVNQLNGPDQTTAVRAYQAKLAAVAVNDTFSEVRNSAQVLRDQENIDRAGSSLPTRNRANRFISQLDAALDLPDNLNVELEMLEAPMQRGAQAEIVSSMAILSNAVTGNWQDIDGQDVGILALALMIDGFILLVMIWMLQERARAERTLDGIRARYTGSRLGMDRLAQDAGYDDTVDAVNALESAGKCALGLPVGFGHIVPVTTPRTSSKLSALLVNLKNAGMAHVLPARVRNTEDMAQQEVVTYLITQSAWRELQAIKTLCVTSPKLSSAMTFGEFVDWVCALPEADRVIGGSRSVRSVIARHFPFAWSIALKDLTHARQEELLASFERTSKLSDSTQKRYRRTFQDMVALAAHKDLLPTEKLASELRIVA